MTYSLAVLGAGVRGTAALGRVVARLRETKPSPLELHIVDPFPAGSGSIWRTDQPHSLVMNTVPAQSTVFDDDSLAFDATFPGPSFAEWCERVTAGEISGEPAWVRRLAREIVPWSSPPRALYGQYLRWSFGTFARALPAGAKLHVHEDRATAIRKTVEGFEISFSGGQTIRADAILLALGWLPREQGPAPHIGPGSPIDQGLDTIKAGERVAVRGIGMGFTDLLSLVTEERGGTFSPMPHATRPGELHYAPSGEEPHIYAGSRTGLPFLAKPDFGTVPPPARFDALRAAIPSLLHRRPLDFDREVLPYIEHAAAWEHYRALSEYQPQAFAEDPAHLLARFEASVASDDERDAWRSAAVTAVSDERLRFAPERIGAATQGRTAREIDTATIERIVADAAEASLGYASAWKRGLHVYQAARAAIIPITEFGGVAAEKRPKLAHYLALANLAGSGPPLFRVEQLIALHRAGVVTFLGPRLEVHREGAELFARSGLAPDSTVAVDRVVDARLDLPDVSRLSDPLLDSLLEAGLARVRVEPHSQPTIEITAEDSALVGADGTPVAGLHSVGPLHEELRRFTIIAPIPGANSTVLREIDAAVAALLARVTSSASPATAAHSPETQESR